MNELCDALQELDEPRRELSQAAVDLLADDGPSPELVEVLADQAMGAYLTERLPPQECRAALDRAIGMAAELDLPEPATALGFRGMMRCLLGELEGLDDYERAIAAATEQGLGKDLMEMQYMYAIALSHMRGSAAALEASGRGLESARRRGDEAHVLLFRVSLVAMHYCSGDWDAALHEARELEAALQATDQVFTLCTLRNFEGSLLADRGTPEEAEPFLDWLVERGRASEQGNLVVGAFAAAAAAYFGLGQVETALGLLAALADRSAGDRWAIGPAPVRMALAAGDADLAGRLADAMGAENPWRERVHITCRALVAEACGENESALVGFANAARRWHEFGMPYEEGQALLGQGRCLMALNKAPEAAPVIEQARAIFNHLGAKPALTETDRLMDRIAADSG